MKGGKGNGQHEDEHKRCKSETDLVDKSLFMTRRLDADLRMTPREDREHKKI